MSQENPAAAANSSAGLAPTGATPPGSAPAGSGQHEQAPATHPRHKLSDILHQPVRFSIVAALARTESAEFKMVRDAIQVSDSVLSKQIAILEDAGYVKVKKGFVGKRPRTWLSLTRQGAAAWQTHLDVLREIAGS